MINSISLQNFKSIRNYTFQLKNLSVAMGINGMGKSSFLQSLLVLRQSPNLVKGELQLNDFYVNLGKGKDVFYQYSKTDFLVFNVVFNDKETQNFKFVYKPEADILECEENSYINKEFFNQPLFSHKFKYLNAERTAPKVIYEKSYREVVINKSVGINGQYTAHFLNEYGNNEIAFQNLTHPRTDTFTFEGSERLDRSLKSQVEYWLGEISPGIRLNTPEIANSDNILLDFQFSQPNRGYTNNFRATNVGFGISYALPIIVTLLAAEPGDLILLENPECHIHPKGQAQLGTLIALLAMNDVQILLETHSDHIINGIRVATNKNFISEDRIVIFNFDKTIAETEQYSNITAIEVDNKGELSHYPNSFMDEWSNQLLKLI